MAQTTPTIDADLVRRLLRRQFPEWADLPIRPVRAQGWDNRTFRLGDALLVRLPSAEAYASQVEKEQTWLPRLAPFLPVRIPEPRGFGRPGEGYPWSWSIYRWIGGSAAAAIGLPELLAKDLAEFLLALHRADTSGGPAPAAHNFFRGGSLSVYSAQNHEAVSRLTDESWAKRASEIWRQATTSSSDGKPVWIHGDFAAGNLLLRRGRLAAVIDFGCMAIGDPACDLVIAWTLLPTAARKVFKAALKFDEQTWARAKGWALWKALILATGLVVGPTEGVETSQKVLTDLLSDER